VEREINDVSEFEVGMETALRYFNRAIATDPGFALAYVGLSDVYEELGWAFTQKHYYDKSAEAAETALEIDPDLAEAQAQVAWIRVTHEHDWGGAEEAYRLANTLDPSCYTPPYFYLWQGRVEEAVRAIKNEVDEYDPLSAELQLRIAIHCYIARDFDWAIERARLALELDSSRSDAFWTISNCLRHQGRLDDAFEAYLKGRRLNGDEASEILKLERLYSEEGWEGVHAMAAEKYLSKKGKDPYFKPYGMALAYAKAGDKDKALEWLERACELPVYLPITTHPDFDTIRREPRYRALLERLNLDQGLADRFRD
jgi:Tfp pilus assembly protein PilF